MDNTTEEAKQEDKKQKEEELKEMATYYAQVAMENKYKCTYFGHSYSEKVGYDFKITVKKNGQKTGYYNVRIKDNVVEPLASYYLESPF